ncbi:hypothetical protein AG1IA_07904 [Rhizoctonia solani AG-1 IA]|uniref:Uncharacterized protein n=1 Tax=Thanatephorus cucumeris (strain AG1-IA) TaxID=983506 RepID=L8WMQ8_THACA|nr:hypothetical protein AG1IA_07904 [Rhizoctonia solani AG-1 IA]
MTYLSRDTVSASIMNPRASMRRGPKGERTGEERNIQVPIDVCESAIIDLNGSPPRSLTLATCSNPCGL